MAVVVLVGMAFSFWWNPLVHHTSGWAIPGDIWSTWRAAHWVGWGALGGVYDDTQLVTFPGIAVALAPFAMLSGHLGLTESVAPIFLTTPTSWYLLGPASLLLGSSCLLAFDAFAEELGVGRRRRIILCWLEAITIFEVVAVWGHPEDLLSLGLALYGVLAVERGHPSRSGWLWGAAIVMQPLVLLLFPLQFARLPRTSRVRVCFLAVLPSLVFVGTPLLSAWGQTSKVLFHQANAPILDHPTPWIVLSPHFSKTTVGAGPGRLLALLVAVGIGYIAWRFRPSMTGFIWLGALALSGRCFFESVMDPFYLGPPLAVIVLAASARTGWRPMVGAWAAAMAATVFSFYHLSEWLYWSPMVVLLGIGLACAWPGRSAFRMGSPPIERGSDEQLLHSHGPPLALTEG